MAFLVAVSAQFFASDLMHLMYSQHAGETAAAYGLRMDQSAQIFRLLMWSFVAISSNYIFGTLLTANNSLKVLNWIAFSGFMLNLILNLILIPVHYAVGAAFASVVTQVMTALLQIAFAVRYFQVKPDYGLLARFVLLIVVLTLSGFIQKQYPFVAWEIRWTVMLLLGLVTALVLKILDIKNLYLILREREGI
jgi:O-antigen/teichoic acid export membrane protein